MNADLHEARRVISADRRLEGFVVRRQGDELHLERAGDIFARLFPTVTGTWRLEVFRDAEEWEIVNFSGSLEECLTQLTEHPRFLFWER